METVDTTVTALVVADVNGNMVPMVKVLVKTLFFDAALVWVNSVLTAGVEMTWTAFVAAFRGKYCGGAHREAALRELVNCSQKSDETVAKFAARLEALGASYVAEDRPRVMLFRFIDGCRPEISQQLQILNPANLQDAVDRASVIEKLVLKNQANGAVNALGGRGKNGKGKQSKPVQCWFCGKLGHKQDECHAKRAADKKPIPKQQQAQARGDTEAGRPPAPVNGDLCFRCGRPGHRQAECRAGRRFQGQINTLCEERDGLLFHPLKVSNRPVLGLVDCGASHACADESIVSHLEVDVGVQRVLAVADNSQLRCVGEVVAEIQIDGITHTCRVQVIANFKYQFLIGLDLLRKFQAFVDVVGKRLVIGGGLNAIIATDPTVILLNKWHSDVPHLTPQQKSRLLELLESYDDIFVDSSDQVIGHRADVEPFDIEVTDPTPIYVPQYRLPVKDLNKIVVQVKEMLRLGVIRESNSPWNFPIVCAPKKDGSERVCINVKKLNDVTKKEKYPLPTFEDITDRLFGCNFLSTFDLWSGYWQMPLTPRASDMLAFTIPGGDGGHYQYDMTPFGPTNAPMAFQRRFARSIRQMIGKNVQVCIDDVVCHTNGFDAHMEILAIVFMLLRAGRWRLKRKKCRFGQREVNLLGHVISDQGVRMDPVKVNKMTELITINSKPDLRSWISFVAYYQKFIPNFSGIAKPLYDKLRKDVPFVWGPAEDQAMKLLKDALIKNVMLAIPNLNLPFDMFTDASDVALGFVLSQENRPISFGSKMLTAAEVNYSTGDKEMLAVIVGLKKFWCYVKGSKVIVFTDHKPNLNFMSRKGSDVIGRHARWFEFLQKCDITLAYVEGKKNVLADLLSRLKPQSLNLIAFVERKPKDEIQVDQRNCPDLKIYFDYFDLKDVKLNVIQRSEVQNMSMIDGCLMHLWSPHPGAKLEETVIQLVVPAIWRRKLLNQCHDLAGHFGVTATFDMLRAKFWWPSLFASVKHYVESCDPCQKVKKALAIPPMMVSTPTRFNERVALDPCGPFPETVSGMKFLIVTIECFSKWVVGYPVPDLTSASVFRGFAENYIYVYGPPEQLLTDRGSSLLSGYAMSFCKEFGIKKVNTTAEHPQTDPAERAIRTVKGIMKKLIIEYGGEWDQHYAKAIACMRWHKSRTTNVSPFQVVFGRKCTIPMLMEYDVFENPSLRMIEHQKINDLVKEELENAGLKNKEYYDERNRVVEEPRLFAGDLVMLSTIRKTNPFDPQQSGPYRIARYATAVTVKLESLDGSKLSFHPTVNISRLTKYFQREEPYMCIFGDEEEADGGDALGDANFGGEEVIEDIDADADLVQGDDGQQHLPPNQDVIGPVPAAQDDSEEEQEYRVEAIIRHQNFRGTTKFLTKFIGYDNPEWINADNFIDDDDTVNETFEAYLIAKKLDIKDFI